MLAPFFEWFFSNLKKLIDRTYTFLDTIWNFIWGVLCEVGSWILDAITWVVVKCQYAFYIALDWVLVWIVEVYKYFIEQIPQINLEGLFSTVSTVTQYSACINSLLPLTEIVSCGTIYLLVVMVWSIYKLVKSWIPTVSGS